jgi:dihydropteroate synthase
MHMMGIPQNMQENPTYDDVVEDIYRFFEKQSSLVINEGLDESKIIIDPGIGFGKTLEHNLEILKRLSEFKSLGFPILVGTSRKSFIGTLTGAEVDERLFGTIASISLAAAQGASIVRVHDVAAAKQALQVIGVVKSEE